MDASCGQLQEMAAHSSLESMLGCSKAANSQQERKPRPQPEQAHKCPRCDSTNTKFCYYNNYSLSQPRYFCKSCRRYWTKGGTLRNVPVGGGCRKNKRSSSSSSATSSSSSLSSKRSQDHQPLMITNTNSLTSFPHLMSYDTTNDLSLAFARLQQKQQNVGTQLGFDHDGDRDSSILGNPITSDALGNPSTHFLDALRSGFLDTNNNFHNLYYGYGSGSNVVDQVDHHHHHDHHHNGVSEEMLMPFGDHHQMSGGSTTNATTTAVTVTTMKQESEHNSNKVLWGFPWQLNNNPDHASSIINNHDLNSNWHGLLNNPLM